MKNIIILVLLLLLSGCQSGETKTQQIEDNIIEGVWKVNQIIYQTPENQFANPEPQAGLFIFTNNYYSIIWNPNAAPQNDYKEKWNPTDSEKVNSYNSSISNSGTYEISGGKLITNPVTANNAAYIGGRISYEFSADENNLTITLAEIMSYDGVKNEKIKNYKTTIKLARLE
jgi:hypothetical protein